MEIKIQLQTLVIKDQETGKEYKVRTLRSAKEIAEFMEESEKEIIADKMEAAINTAYIKDNRNQRGNLS